MGASKAATKLMHMDADARNSIIESMAPRAAANTLASMEDAVQQAQVDGDRPQSPEVGCGAAYMAVCCSAVLLHDANCYLPWPHMLLKTAYGA